MDDGPEPMKDLKPAPKNPNSADQFRETHETEYEARAQASAVNVDKVLQHNMAYPKLVDELDKRRSVVQIKATKTHNSHPKCIACKKLRQLAELQKLKIKPRCCKSKPRRRSVSRKKRNRQRTKRAKNKNVTIQKARRNHSDAYTSNMMKHFKIQSRNGSRKPFRSREVEINDNSSQTNSVANTLKYPDTSERSISSYNSYPSLDHEPLVKYMEP